MTSVLSVLLLVGLLPAADDDLTVVRRALAVTTTPAPAPPRGDKPRWLRVRVVEKGAKKAKVSVNLPFGLVRAFGDECPVQWCRKGDVHLADLLAALESGQKLVEIEDEEATVRVWVD